MSMRSPFSTPWVPFLGNRELPDTPITLDLIVDQVRPTSRRPEDVAWTNKGCESELQGASSSARPALEETIVALWRMRGTLEDGRGDELYLDHLEAWLVRRLDRDRGVGGRLIGDLVRIVT